MSKRKITHKRKTHKRKTHTHKRKTHTHKRKTHTHKRTHLYRKRRQLSIIPNSNPVELFTAPEKTQTQVILVNQTNKQGNIIAGLREMR